MDVVSGRVVEGWSVGVDAVVIGCSAIKEVTPKIGDGPLFL